MYTTYAREHAGWVFQRVAFFVPDAGSAGTADVYQTYAKAPWRFRYGTDANGGSNPSPVFSAFASQSAARTGRTQEAVNQTVEFAASSGLLPSNTGNVEQLRTRLLAAIPGRQCARHGTRLPHARSRCSGRSTRPPLCSRHCAARARG